MAIRGGSAAERPEEQELVITRVFDAPRDPGGAYLYCMRSSEGKEYWGKGVYREIVESERIVCTDRFANEKGDTVSPQAYGMSPDWPEEALITVTFDEQGGKTRFTLRHAPLKPGPERDMCHQGWSESLDKLEDYLAKAKE